MQGSEVPALFSLEEGGLEQVWTVVLVKRALRDLWRMVVKRARAAASLAVDVGDQVSLVGRALRWGGGLAVRRAGPIESVRVCGLRGGRRVNEVLDRKRIHLFSIYEGGSVDIVFLVRLCQESVARRLQPLVLATPAGRHVLLERVALNIKTLARLSRELLLSVFSSGRQVGPGSEERGSVVVGVVQHDSFLVGDRSLVEVFLVVSREISTVLNRVNVLVVRSRFARLPASRLIRDKVKFVFWMSLLFSGPHELIDELRLVVNSPLHVRHRLTCGIGVVEDRTRETLV